MVTCLIYYQLDCIHPKMVWLLEQKPKYSSIIFNYLKIYLRQTLHIKTINADSKLNKSEMFLEKIKQEVQKKYRLRCRRISWTIT